MGSILVITNPNTSIARKAGRLIISEKDKITEIKAKDLDSVILFGNIQISIQAVRLLADEGVVLSNLTFDGKPKFAVLPAEYVNSDLRIRQYENFKDPNRRLHIARKITYEKVNNSYLFLKKAKSRNKKFSMRALSKETKAVLKKIEQAVAIDELMGYEGNFSKTYFEYLSGMSNGKVKFTKRSKKPPKDEANALLSFIYTLAYNLISGIIYGSGFDPYVGFLHSEDYGRNSFALDILELYRANFCDRLFINITNRNIITPLHFAEKDGGYFLTDEGKKKFFAEWKKAVYDYKKPSDSIIYDITQKLTEFSKILRG
jgi:CRISPR-associated protein Cas1